MYERPFQDEVKQRLILHTRGFWLDGSQFRSVCEAASAVGDEHLLYSDVRGYLGGQELMPYYTWELSLFEYDEYCDSDDEPVNREHDIGIPLDRVLYSPAGDWAVLLPDIFAVMGGWVAFVEQFKTVVSGVAETRGYIRPNLPRGRSGAQCRCFLGAGDCLPTCTETTRPSSCHNRAHQ